MKTTKLSFKDGKKTAEVYIGDCRPLLTTLQEQNRSFEMIFADPPYNIGVEYDNWDDAIGDADYQKFTKTWLKRCNQLLTEDGSLWVYVTPSLGCQIASYATKNLGLHLINRIVVVQRFGQHQTNRFISGYRDLLYLCRSRSSRIWNAHEILVPSDRAAKYGDKRTFAKQENKGLRVPLDVWGYDEPYFGRVQGSNAERRKLHKNQVPEKVLERAVLVASSKGDTILDPFCGSGTTGTVAIALNRNFVGLEISRAYARSAMDRIKEGPARVSPRT